MKLLFISTPAFADCDFPLIRTFQEKGLDVTYLLLLPPFAIHSTLIDIVKQIPKTGIFPATIYPELKVYEDYMDFSKVFVANRIGWSSMSLSYWKDTFNIRKFIKQGRFDIIHFDSYFTGYRKRFYKIAPFVTTFHDPFPHTGEKKDNQQQIYQYAAKHSKGIVLLNNKQVEEFCMKYDVSPEKVLVNRLGVYDNIKVFIEPSDDDSHDIILFFGRISPYKGIEYLCEAMTKVHEQIPNAKLIIAGGGKMYFDITPYEKLDYIKIHNRYIDMKELADLVSCCSLCVCPYTDATQSGVIMTAFSLGKPVVASNIGGLGEVIEDGKNGFLVPPKDPNALAEALIKLLKEKSLRKQMSNYILEEYQKGEKSWDKIADKYINYYQSIIM